MTYTAISVIGLDIYVVTNRIVCRWRLQCCRMAITIYPRQMKLLPPTWQRHRLIIAFTIVPIGLSPGVEQYLKAHPRLDASLLQWTLVAIAGIQATRPGQNTAGKNVRWGIQYEIPAYQVFLGTLWRAKFYPSG
jgi:hypothetical protein